MPHRRKNEKGSFGGHFDELVTQFPAEPGKPNKHKPDKPSDHNGNVHDRLFESAWRRARTKPHHHR